LAVTKKTVGDGEKLLTYLNSALKVLSGLNIFPRGTKKKSYIMLTSVIIQPLGQVWQEPEPIQATGMALAHCILGKFLGVVCHYFPLPLDVPTFAARCLHVPNNVSAPSSERWNCGQEFPSITTDKITVINRNECYGEQSLLRC
jgi:hypothetical protein